MEDEWRDRGFLNCRKGCRDYAGKKEGEKKAMKEKKRNGEGPVGCW